MSDENFLTRWSRRKRAAAEETDAAVSAVPAAAPAPAAPVDSAPVAPEAAKPSNASPVQGTAVDKEVAFDLARLPPIESITATTDIRAFLQPGVPPELARAALRRVWAADPAIRDFVGLAENAWDFNTPGAIPGFGSLEMTDELRRQVMQMVGRRLQPEAHDRPDPTATMPSNVPPGIETSTELPAPSPARPTKEHPVQVGTGQEQVGTGQEEPVNNNDKSQTRDELIRTGQAHIALQQNTEKVEVQQTTARRSHGRALPE